LLYGTSPKALKFGLGRWFGKERYLTVTLPGKDPLTAFQFNEWLAYYNIEPFGEFRSELRFGSVMALTANLNRDSKNKPEPFTALDFMNYVERPPEKVYSDAELEAYAEKVFGK
jgi:hypothetical protein